MIELFCKALGAYLIGNLMGGQLVGRLRGGVDLSKVGSGNIGATNALRTQGKGFALAVLLIDIFKGVAAVVFVPAVQWSWAGPTDVSTEIQAYICGVAVAVGHCYPVFSGFKGGKGVATLAGVFGALMPIALLWMLGGFILTVLLTGYVSLATLVAAVLSVIYAAQLGLATSAFGFAVAMALLVVWKHRENIQRLIKGNESRFEKARVLGRWLSR
ncbi:MAG: glycerol-3-phosphate 1-O-acyltransferase PlsY [Pseudomonadota bacterium]